MDEHAGTTAVRMLIALPQIGAWNIAGAILVNQSTD
jgi:hypothetical protein